MADENKISEDIKSVPDTKMIEVSARLILGKNSLSRVQTLWGNASNEKFGDKISLKCYVINDGSHPDVSPNVGSPVKEIRLCKRIIAEDYPKCCLMGNNKLKITHCYALILLIEYENGQIKLMVIPKSLSLLNSYRPEETLAFFDPINQDPIKNEKLSIENKAASNTMFCYATTLLLSDFVPTINASDLHNPSLESQVILKNLDYEVNVAEPHLMKLDETRSIWTTCVEMKLSEDIITRLGIDQDIILQGTTRSMI